MRELTRWRTFAVALIAAQAVMLFVILRQSYFREDDYAILANFAQKSFFSYVFEPFGGHLLSGQLLLAAAPQLISPLNFTVVVLVLVALQSCAGAIVWRLLCELVGASWPAIAGLVVFLFAPLATVSVIWYAAALTTIPLQLAVAGTLLHHVRFIRTRRTREIVAACAFFVVGVFFLEKALIALLVLACVTVLWFPAGRGVRGALRSLRRDRRAWAVYLGIVALYLPLYFAVTTQIESPRPSVGTYPLAIWRALTGGAIPYLLGGPFADAERAVDSTPLVTHGWAYLVGFVVFAVLTVMRQRSAWRAWLLLGVYLVAEVTVTTFVRGGYFGSLVGLAPRYLADLTLIAAIALTLALLPVRSTDSMVGAASRLEAGRPHDTVPAPSGWEWGYVGFALMYVGLAFITSSYAVKGMSGTKIRAFVATARRDLAELGEVAVYDAATPPWVTALGSSRQVLQSMELPVRFDTPTSQLYTLDMDGHLRPSLVGAVATGRLDPGACGTLVDNGARVRVDLNEALFNWRWVIRLDYFIGADAALSVTAAGVRQEAVVRSADHQLFLEVTGELDHIDLGLIGGTAPMCLTGVTVGTVTPQPAP